MIESGKTVVLHIGRHKTGTSSIQDTLKKNDVEMLQKGFLFPRSVPANQSAFFVNAFSNNPESHPVNRRDNICREQIERRVNRQLNAIREEFQSFRGYTVIFSAEDAGTVLQADNVAKIKSVFDSIFENPNYRVLLYTRHPVSWLKSAVQQNVKGNSMTLEQSVSYHVQAKFRSYRAIFENYSKVFGEDNVNFRSFEQSFENPAGIVGDFMEAIGADMEGISLLRSNESISPEIVHFLSWLYDGPRSGSEPLQHNNKPRVEITEKDRNLLFKIVGGTSGFIKESELDEYWRNVQDDISFLKEKFGISYEIPTGASLEEMFVPGFWNTAREIVPNLATPLQQYLIDFLDFFGFPKDEVERFFLQGGGEIPDKRSTP